MRKFKYDIENNETYACTWVALIIMSVCIFAWNWYYPSILHTLLSVLIEIAFFGVILFLQYFTNRKDNE